MADLLKAVNNLQEFTQGSLKKRVSELEDIFCKSQANKTSSEVLASQLGINLSLLDSALLIKHLAGQINEVIHTIGILLLLPHILVEGEGIESLSLAAGNTGRNFDLETNYRIAEFKFINWKGGAEVIRQNALFKDFYWLAEADTHKKRFLYVIGDKHPLKFFNGKRGLKSVMSKDAKLFASFYSQYGEQFLIVSDYYRHYPPDWVQIEDVTQYIRNFSSLFESQNDHLL